MGDGSEALQRSRIPSGRFERFAQIGWLAGRMALGAAAESAGVPCTRLRARVDARAVLEKMLDATASGAARLPQRGEVSRVRAAAVDGG